MRFLALILTAALAISSSAGAVTVSRLYEFEADTPAQAEQVNDEFDNIISAINGNLDGLTNITQGSIATGNIATGAITTPKIATGAVTRAAMASLGQATSNSSMTQFVQSQNETQFNFLSASLFTSGRPVWAGLQPIPGQPGRILYQHAGVGATDNAARLNIKRDGATRNVTLLGVRQTAAGAISSLPCSAVSFVDIAPDGGENHSYAVFGNVASADTGILRIENCQLVLFEL